MNATHALGWALVHFLWQGAALAVLLAVALTVTRATAARARYALSVATLAVMALLPLVTAVRLQRSAAVPAGAAAPDLPALTGASDAAPRGAFDHVTKAPATSSATPPSPPLRARLDPLLPGLVVLWVAGVVVLSIRLARGWTTARRLRTHGTRTASAPLRELAHRLAARLRVSRPVQLLESAIVEVPAVIGWLRPVILVPASALTGLAPQQLELLIAHELAHVRRHDYLVNLAQSVIETLLFYHPAVWWVSRRVREEREHCCDDLVVQICGDPHFYASALVGMERLRSTAPPLALAATGGSLVHRVRRLLVPGSVRAELFPRWTAGVVAVTIALLAAGGAQVTGEPVIPADAGSGFIAADTTQARPDTVVRHPDPSQPLAQRWEWARTQARQLGRRTYWIGYRIAQPAWLEHSVYVDREIHVTGENVRLSGRLFGDFQGLAFRGVRLAPLVGGGDSDDIVLLFGFTDQGRRAPALVRVHVASFYLPADFAGRTLFWLGDAEDAQSVPIVESLFAATPRSELREDVMAAVGIHGSSDIVVPILIRWLTASEPAGVRAEAAEWLGFHPTAAAVSALSRAARSDAAGDVRREAAEALGDSAFPAATDSAIAIARTAGDADVRREAVEGLGQKDSERALAVLVAIAQNDRDQDVQREAVETLGEMPGGRGLNAVRDLARTHPRPDVRREAVETLGEHLPAAEAITALRAIATDDAHSDVQREAVETLGDLHDAAGALAALTEFARTHPNADVRREAVETIGERAPTAQAIALLDDIARRDRSPDVQREAVQALGQLGDARSFTLLVEFARTHPVSDVRREAIETLGESGGRVDSVIAILDEIARSTGNEDAAREAVESLGELHDPRALGRVARIARAHADVDVRREAIETYAESADPDSAVTLLTALLASDAPEDVYRQALESLEELPGGVGIPPLIEAARSHPNRAVRALAFRRLAESDDPRAQELFERTLRRPD